MNFASQVWEGGLLHFPNMGCYIMPESQLATFAFFDVVVCVSVPKWPFRCRDVTIQGVAIFSKHGLLYHQQIRVSP